MIKRIFLGAGCLFLLLIAFWNLSEAGVLVLDVRMPEMSGIEVQEKVVNSGSKMPAVFMTDHENEERQKVAMESGAVL